MVGGGSDFGDFVGLVDSVSVGGSDVADADSVGSVAVGLGVGFAVSEELGVSLGPGVNDGVSPGVGVEGSAVLGRGALLGAGEAARRGICVLDPDVGLVEVVDVDGLGDPELDGVAVALGECAGLGEGSVCRRVAESAAPPLNVTTATAPMAMAATRRRRR